MSLYVCVTVTILAYLPCDVLATSSNLRVCVCVRGRQTEKHQAAVGFEPMTLRCLLTFLPSKLFCLSASVCVTRRQTGQNERFKERRR